MTSNIKLHVSVPCLGGIKAETAASLLAFTQKTKYPHSIDIQKNTYIHYARNKAVMEAVKQGATHLMFVDSDMQFAPGDIDYLVEMNEDIIGGLYFGRVVPFPVAKMKHQTRNAMTNPISLPEEEQFEVMALGTGFLLINMDVFKKMQPPFFFHSEPKDWGMEEMPFPHNEIGEDVSFCLKAREHGFKIIADQSLNLIHVGEKKVTKEDFQKWIKAEREAYAKQKKEHDRVIQ